MITKKSWAEFRHTGLLLIINQVLHVFGWAIVLEIENGEVVDAYPARVKYRGFSGKVVDESYRKVSKYLADNAKELNDEIAE